MRLIDADEMLLRLQQFDQQELYLPCHFKDFIIEECLTIEVEEWHDVKSELPNENEWVLIQVKQKFPEYEPKYYCARFENGSKKWDIKIRFYDGFLSHYLEEVIAWKRIRGVD